MQHRTSRRARAASVTYAMTIVAGFGVTAWATGPLPPQVPPPSGQVQTASGVPPLVIEAVAVDRNGQVVMDMRASDFLVTVDGQPRPNITVAPLFRGPGALGLAGARAGLPPGEQPPRAEPSRIVVIVADQGSFLPGDDRRAMGIAENCLGLLGLADRVMFLRLPDLAGAQTLSADREPVRQALRFVQALRPRYGLYAETPAEERPPSPPVVSDPAVEAQPVEELPTRRAVFDLEDLPRRVLRADDRDPLCAGGEGARR